LTDIIFLVLLIVHIGTVVLWMGGAILFVSVFGPLMSKFSGPTKAEFMKIIGPAYEKYIIRNATIAIIAGVILFGYISRPGSGLAPTDTGFPWLVAGVLLALVAYIIGLAVIRPANHKLWALTSQSPPSQSTGGPAPDSQMLQRRVAASSGIQALLLALALLSMVLGANL
jgi:uncharacterized membrane protein